MYINSPIVTNDSMVLKNKIEEMSCSPDLYCMARITPIEAVGIESVITDSLIISGVKLNTCKIPSISSGRRMFLANTEMLTVLLKVTLYENRIIPDAKRATPPVALPSRLREDIMLVGKETRSSKNISPSTGIQTTGSFIALSTFPQNTEDLLFCGPVEPVVALLLSIERRMIVIGT